MSEIRWVARSASGYMNNITEGNDTFTWNGLTWTSAKPVGYKPTDSRIYIVFQTAYVNSPGDTGNKYHSYSFSGWGSISSLTSDYYPIFNNATDANNYNQGLEYNINNLIAGTIPEPPIVYNWQSVPSISGKNGILSLPVLVSIDGEPVSSGSASDFSVLPSSAKVRTLADANI